MRYVGRQPGQRGGVLLVRCACGKLIRHQAGEYRVRCDCGRSEAIDAVRPEGDEDTAVVDVPGGDVRGWT